MNSHECATIRKCSKCGSEKPLEAFSKKAVWCKPCVSAYDKEIYQRKREIILQQKVEYRKNNKEKIAESHKEWRNANPDYVANYQKNYRQEKAAEIAEKKKAYYEAHRDEIIAQKRIYSVVARDQILANKKKYYQRPDKYGIIAVNRDRRRSRQETATPSWADIQAMRDIYARSKMLTKMTGVQHHVDHIIPLRGETVSGLHVHTNLQIVTAVENLRKSNKLIEDIV